MKLNFVLLACICFLASCTPDKNWKKETVETFTVRKGEQKYHRDTRSYKEVNYYDEKNHLRERHIFDKVDSLKGKEVYEIGANDLATGSKYYAPDGTLLSYYTFHYDNAGNKIRTAAYEAETDELLRLERFEYDNRGNRIRKEILDQNSVVQQSFRFGFDDSGNEINIAAFTKDDELIFEENHDITTYNSDGKWKQSWGFRNKTPKSVKYRELEKTTPLN